MLSSFKRVDSGATKFRSSRSLSPSIYTDTPSCRTCLGIENKTWDSNFDNLCRRLELPDDTPYSHNTRPILALHTRLDADR